MGLGRLTRGRSQANVVLTQPASGALTAGQVPKPPVCAAPPTSTGSAGHGGHVFGMSGASPFFTHHGVLGAADRRAQPIMGVADIAADTLADILHAAMADLAVPTAVKSAPHMPLPRWGLPQSNAREIEEDGRFHFDVDLIAPFGLGWIVRYRGWLARAGAQDSAGLSGSPA